VIEPTRLAPVFVSEDFGGDLERLSSLFGPPGLVDGERFAQFDTSAGRICLAAPGEVGGPFAVLCRVDDLEAAAGACEAAGLSSSGIAVGEHEERLVTSSPSGLALIFYRLAARPSEPGAAT